MIEDTERLNQELQEWKSVNCGLGRPPPLIIEVYLDLGQLAQNQSLVAFDEHSKPWDVSEALHEMVGHNSSGPIPTEVVYERWTIQLDDPSALPVSALIDSAPSVYKKGVVAMRSLYTYTKYLPAWRFGRRLGRQAGSGPMLRPRYRIVDASLLGSSGFDSLTYPLFPSEEVSTETFQFVPLNCVFGSLKTSVVYRRNCDFLVEATEKLLSTKAMRSAHENRRSHPPTRSSQTQFVNETSRTTATRNIGNLPRESPGPQPPHTDPFEDRGSPLSAVPSSLPGDVPTARMAAGTSVPRRTSVTFQPFKAGSLSSSPSAGFYAGSPSSSVGRSANNSLNSHSRNRSSITTLPQQALRAPQFANEAAATSSASSSPKPAPLQRYSSSFSNRRSRFPSSGNIKGDDDNLSSGRASVSSATRGSTILPGPEASSASAQAADAENIADFLKLLDKNKGLQSFSGTEQAANAQRTTAQYSKFARMRDSTAQLSESMSSSLMLHRSSSSSSRQLHNVPGMIPGSSLSTSSSPGKPISPHTPHLPAIPSRLSNNSITADYSRATSRSRPVVMRAPDSNDGADMPRAASPRIHAAPGSTAIDIPTSPRTFPANRRSSSVAQQARTRPDVDDHDGMHFGLRSASMPNDQGPELSLSELLMQTESGTGGRRRRDLVSPAAAADDDDEPLLFALAE